MINIIFFKVQFPQKKTKFSMIFNGFLSGNLFDILQLYLRLKIILYLYVSTEGKNAEKRSIKRNLIKKSV
jgi:hypothetical protein